MKQITLIRHSKTEVIYDGITDLERELKGRGIKDAQLIASNLKINGYLPQLIITSHAKRAYQTAYIMAAEIGYPEKDIRTEPFIYNGYTTAEFLKFISGIDDQIQSVWVIGHNPDIALIGMRLSDEDFYHFPTTASAVINFKTAKWTGVFEGEGKAAYFVTPSMMKDED